MLSVFNYYTVGELMEELENNNELSNGEYNYYIENSKIKFSPYYK